MGPQQTLRIMRSSGHKGGHTIFLCPFLFERACIAFQMTLRFLCLHGYGQCSEVLRSRTGALRRALKAFVGDFVFVDAPHKCTHFLPEDPGVEVQRFGWWDWTVEPDGQKTRFGWKESQAKLLAMVDQDVKGFDGIFGFSQGAIAGAFLCAKRPSRFRMAVLVSGGVPTDPRMYADLVEACNKNILMPPSIHVYGEADQLIEPAKVLDLVGLWPGPAAAWGHPGGHMIPSSKDFRNTLCDFVQRSACAPKIKEGTCELEPRRHGCEAANCTTLCHVDELFSPLMIRCATPEK